MSPGLRSLRIAIDAAAEGRANDPNPTTPLSMMDAHRGDPPGTNDPEEDDVIHQALRFLVDKISDDDMARLEEILMPPPGGGPLRTFMAADSVAARRYRRMRAVRLIAQDADLVRRFPNAGRLGRI